MTYTYDGDDKRVKKSSGTPLLARHVKRRSAKSSGKGRTRQYYKWELLHDEIEVYDRHGKRLGAIDPETHEWIKEAVPRRNIKAEL